MNTKKLSKSLDIFAQKRYNKRIEGFYEMKKLTQEQIQKIEEVINKGDRIEVIPVKDGIKIIQETRKEIKFNKKTC